MAVLSGIAHSIGPDGRITRVIVKYRQCYPYRNNHLHQNREKMRQPQYHDPSLL